MKKFEFLGIICATIFALCGCNENGLCGYMGLMVFGLVMVVLTMINNENKRRSFQRVKKSLIRHRASKRINACY